MDRYLDDCGVASPGEGAPQTSNPNHSPAALHWGLSGPESSASDGVGELLRVHEYERQRLGQELHDSAGQLLVSLHLSIARLRQLEENCGHRPLIDEMSETVSEIDREIRGLAFLHCPMELAGAGLCSALERLAREFERRTGIRTSFTQAGGRSPDDEPVSVAFLRVAQEALVNIYRHSHARVASLALERGSDSLSLTISDNGVGVAASATAHTGQGIGISGMRHRVEMLGGEFEIRDANPGTQVSAVVPRPRPGSAGS